MFFLYLYFIYALYIFLYLFHIYIFFRVPSSILYFYSGWCANAWSHYRDSWGSLSAILDSGHMEQELSSACRAAADALEVLSHLRPGFTRNVVPRLNSTSVSPRQANNGERLTVNSEEPGQRQTINEESAVQSTSSPVFTNSSIQTRLSQHYFQHLARTELAGRLVLVGEQQGQSSP